MHHSVFNIQIRDDTNTPESHEQIQLRVWIVTGSPSQTDAPLGVAPNMTVRIMELQRSTTIAPRISREYFRSWRGVRLERQKIRQRAFLKVTISTAVAVGEVGSDEASD